MMYLRGGGTKPILFNPSGAQKRIDRMWSRDAEDGNSLLGLETQPHRVYFEELLADRYSLVSGMQLINDELMLSFNKPESNSNNVFSWTNLLS